MKYAYTLIVFLTTFLLKSQSIEIIDDRYGSPDLSADIEITDENGQIVSANVNNILIRQLNFIIKPTRVYQVGSVQRVEWIPNIQQGSQADFVLDYEYEVFYSGADEVISTESTIPAMRLPKMAIQAQNGAVIDEIEFPLTNNTFTTVRQFKLRLNKGVWNESLNDYEGVVLDSIVYDDEAFRVNSTILLPDDLGQSGEYRFNVVFAPQDVPLPFVFYSTVVKMYFNGGYTLSLDLFGNVPQIERNFDIELLKPEDGEVIAPCTEYEIRWTGANSAVRAYVDISLDGGQTYEELTSTFDTSYVYTVPDTITDLVRFRVRQEASTEEFNMNIPQISGPQKVAISPNSIYGAIANESEEIYIYNVLGNRVERVLKFSESSSTQNTDLLFANEEVVVHTYYRERFSMRNDTFAVYNAATKSFSNNYFSPTPVKRLRNYKDELILITPDKTSSVYTFDHRDGSFNKLFRVDYPIADLSYSVLNNQIVVVDYTGRVMFFNGDSFVLEKEFQIKNFPQPGHAIISPDGEYLAASKYFLPGVVQNIAVYDVERGRRIREVPTAWASDTKGLEFAPNSRQLLMAHGFNPQLVVSDLTSLDLLQSISTEGGSSEILDFNYAREDNQFIYTQQGKLVRFAMLYPQYDFNDRYVKFRSPEFEVTDIELTTTLVADTSLVVNTASVCNTTGSAFPIENVWFDDGREITLLSPTEGFLQAGECINFEFVFHPDSIGDVNDTLFYASCVDTLVIPINGLSLERSLAITDEPYEFGERCLGDLIELEDTFFTNLDTAAIQINRIEFTGEAFSSQLANDTIVDEGDSWGGTVSLVPLKRGLQIDTMLIFNSGMENGPPIRFAFSYFGLGADITQGHKYLSFTPEQQERRSFIVNDEPTPITINELNLASGGFYSVSGDVPITLNQGDTLYIDAVTTNSSRYDTLTVSAEPCINFERMILGPYTVNSAKIIAYDSEAKPTEYGTLVFAQQTDAENYFDGPLKLDLEIRIDAESYLPLEYESKYQIISSSDDIIGSERSLKFNMIGNFGEFDTILKMTGPVALTEFEEVDIKPSRNLGLFSTSITTDLVNGTLRIINDSPGRLIFNNGNNLNVTLYPNPTSSHLTVRLESTENPEESIRVATATRQEKSIYIGIYESTGRKITELSDVMDGTDLSQEFRVAVGHLYKGEYFVEVVVDGISTGTVKFIKE